MEQYYYFDDNAKKEIKEFEEDKNKEDKNKEDKDKEDKDKNKVNIIT